MYLLEHTLGTALENIVKKTPDKDFIIYPDRNLRFSYKTFDDRVNKLAKGLLTIGIKKGDHVGIWATNVPDWLTFLFATAKIGSVLVTINTSYKVHELEYLIKNADLKALCLIDGWRDSDYVGMVNELIPELKIMERGQLKSQKFPVLEHVVFIGQEKHRGMYNTPELLLLGEHVNNDELNAIKNSLNSHEVINMQYTSGTTGFPKGVMLTHHNILNNGYYIGECQKFTSEEILCLPVPLFHCFGIVLGVLALLSHGGTLAIIESFDPLMVLASVQKEKCTALYGVPTMFIAELNHPMFDMFDLSSLRTGIMAGSPCPMDVMKKVVEKMHMNEVTIAYGLTEGSPVMTQTRTDDPLDARVSTVGKELPAIEVKVVNPETGEECAPDEQGEVCCRGYNIMKGYYNNEAATKEAIDNEGWLHSGDLGLKTNEGYFKITGRIKDMIIRGGENIYPREIEEFLYGMPGIRDVQVAGVPSPKYGEQVGAFIILDENSSLTESDVMDYCRGKIARFKIPKYVFFVSGYPMTASGKIQKYKLGEQGLEMLKEKGIEII
ncbi:AMP-binding protein [Saccharicrinis sp. FJH62]|uniref:AMP-binding protein n=1 Tax=Saccharicrinis sp. FJH62 TaxID=3344657 RepID=UPI0035D50176